MPMDSSKRGRHFASPAQAAEPASAKDAQMDEATRDVLRTWGGAQADPGETAVFLRAAGVSVEEPVRAASTSRPDETAVFLAAARGVSSSRLVAPDGTASFVAAAPVSDKPLLSDDDWSPRGAVEPKHATDDDEWQPQVGAPIKGIAVDDGDWASDAPRAVGSVPDSGRAVSGDEGTVFAPLPSDTTEFASDMFRAAGSFSDPAEPEGAHVDAPVDDAADLAAPMEASSALREDGDEDDMGSSDYGSVGRSATLMTVLTIVSRVTGFIRTWAMAAAIGMSLLSSSYQVANNLPNMLYELVMGGMLVTAFLPVYMGVRREQGREASNEYVGNLLGILLLVLGAISVLGTVFAPGFIWTQAFLSSDFESMDTAVFLFRFFAIQILFYGLGSVFSGVLNAHRDYFWSTFAPVLNNVIVIASFMGFGYVSSINETAGIVLIAAGTTLGVFVQMACQIPALAKHGVHPHIHIDFHDPALRQTVALGIPTLLATVCMFVSTSITNAAALVVQPETGPSVIAYARLWYTLPYALIAASLSTALYTELSHDAQEKDFDGVRTGISNGVAQMLFFLIPFALYLIVFARPLNMIYCTGKFDASGVELVSEFLVFLSLSLPLYGVVVLMQKSFSALLDMKPYSRYCLYSAIGQAGSVVLFGVVLGYGMPAIALSYVVDYVILCGCSLWWLRRRLKGLRVKTILHGLFFGLVLGLLGAAAGGACLWALQTYVAPLGTSLMYTLAYVVVSGLVSLAVTFGLAAAFKLPEISALLRSRG